MPLAPNPLWMDDFLGQAVDSRWETSVTPGASVAISTNPTGGGVVQLGVSYSASASQARLRLGGASPASVVPAPNWNAFKDITYEARVFFNSNVKMSATVGFTGLNDPDNVLAAIYDGGTGTTPGTWVFQVRSVISGVSSFTNVATTFTHVPGTWVVFRITTSRLSNSTLLYANDELIASYTGASIPIVDLCAEFQVFNKAGVTGSAPTMWVDYAYMTQTR